MWNIGIWSLRELQTTAMGRMDSLKHVAESFQILAAKVLRMRGFITEASCEDSYTVHRLTFYKSEFLLPFIILGSTSFSPSQQIADLMEGEPQSRTVGIGDEALWRYRKRKEPLEVGMAGQTLKKLGKRRGA